jgi:hypothetical protein
MKKITPLLLFLFFIGTSSLPAQTRHVAKMPLYEVFSSSDCPNCAAANPVLNNVLAQRQGKYVAIKNQYWFPHNGDPYCNKENDTRLVYYQSNSASLPSMAVNGTLYKVNGLLTYTSFTTDLFDQYTTETTPLEIAATYTQTNERKFDVKVTLTAQTNLNGDLKLFVVLCEKRTIKNKMTNGETEFFHVAKKYINGNGTNGFTILNLVPNTPNIYTASFEVKGDYRLPANGLNNLIDWSKEHSIEDFNNLEVAVFVQDATTKTVYQAAYAEKVSSGISDELFENNRLRIYPNPSKGIAVVDFILTKATPITIDIYNVLGEYVKTIGKAEYAAGNNSLSFDTAPLHKGIYFIRMYNDQHTVTKKIVVD